MTTEAGSDTTAMAVPVSKASASRRNLEVVICFP
jgi:hypothetical protein